MSDNPVVPIKEVREIIGLNGVQYRANICIDRDGKECTSTWMGYNLISKDGKRVLKRKTNCIVQK